MTKNSIKSDIVNATRTGHGLFGLQSRSRNDKIASIVGYLVTDFFDGHGRFTNVPLALIDINSGAIAIALLSARDTFLKKHNTRDRKYSYTLDVSLE